MTSGEALQGVSVAVLGGGRGMGRELALGMADLGAAVGIVTDEPIDGSTEVDARTGPVSGPEGELVCVGCPFRSGADVEDALALVSQRIGRVAAVVDAPSSGLAAVPTPLTELDEAGWMARAETPLQRARYSLQGTYRHLRGRGGRVVVVLPSLSMTGASGLVAWVSASEGYRALTKAAARAWGAEGITVNCVAVPGQLAAGGARDASSLDRPGLPSPALGRSPEGRTEVAAAVATLLGEGLRLVTGATIAVDGGVWMTP
jgi:NAD(P)-dependent dehydrogenase (short-subunit alcohol dehydrogenase family)